MGCSAAQNRPREACARPRRVRHLDGQAVDRQACKGSRPLSLGLLLLGPSALLAALDEQAELTSPSRHTQVDAGGFRESNVVHSFSGLAGALDKIYAMVPDDTLILSATTLPFEAGIDYVSAAKKGGELDRGDRLQGGWYGGKKAGVDWWERETMKVTVLQAAMQK